MLLSFSNMVWFDVQDHESSQAATASASTVINSTIAATSKNHHPPANVTIQTVTTNTTSAVDLPAKTVDKVDKDEVGHNRERESDHSNIHVNTKKRKENNEQWIEWWDNALARHNVSKSMNHQLKFHSRKRILLKQHYHALSTSSLSSSSSSMIRPINSQFDAVPITQDYGYL